MEAKLNVLNEENIHNQLSKYVDIGYFEAAKGINMGYKIIFLLENLMLCILEDQSGLIYLGIMNL